MYGQDVTAINFVLYMATIQRHNIFGQGMIPAIVGEDIALLYCTHFGVT